MRYFLLGFVLACASCATPTLTNTIDYSNVTITSIAETVLEECGNTVPDGECLPTSLITTEEKSGIKADLRTVAEMLDLAEISRLRGDIDGSAARIETARNLLAYVEQFLRSRGVE